MSVQVKNKFVELGKIRKFYLSIDGMHGGGGNGTRARVMLLGRFRLDEENIQISRGKKSTFSTIQKIQTLMLSAFWICRPP